MVRALYATLGTSRSLWLGWHLVIDNQGTATWKEKSWKEIVKSSERGTSHGRRTIQARVHHDAHILMPSHWDSVTLCQCYNCWACTLTQEFLRDELEEEQERWFKWDLWLSSLNITKKNNLPLADHIDVSTALSTVHDNYGQLWVLCKRKVMNFWLPR